MLRVGYTRKSVSIRSETVIEELANDQAFSTQELSRNNRTKRCNMTEGPDWKLSEHDIQEVRRFLDTVSAMRICDSSRGVMALSEYYSLSAQIWEGYSVRAHTARVLLQDKRYFNHSPLPPSLSKDQFSLFLALHDIGKGLGKDAQHDHTDGILESLRASGVLLWDDRQFAIVRQLLHDEKISLYSSLFKHVYKTRPALASRERLKVMCEERDFAPLPRAELLRFAAEMSTTAEDHRRVVDELVRRYHSVAGELEIPTRDLYRLHLRYFQVDTSAYSNESLDDEGRRGYHGFEYVYKLQEECDDGGPLFVWNEARERLVFADALEPLVQRLEEALEV